jgi:acyl-CoA reductase-like NAD-dependent aldehyde dehydrogenase
MHELDDLMTLADIKAPAIPAFARTDKQHFIGGRWVAPLSGGSIATENPATEENITRIARGGSADVDAAVQSARGAFESAAWSGMNPHDRSRLMIRIARAVADNSEELAQLETLENGMPLAISRQMLAATVRTFEYFAGWPTRITGSIQPTDPTLLAYTNREPIGVCGQIIPWNAPMTMAGWKIAPAIACGNTVVMKPAEQTSLGALRLAELMAGVGLPDGVVNIVTGTGDEVGEALVEHAGIDKVAFTGSTRVGKQILRKSADTLKKVTLELGGKSPNIIFPDGDIDKALFFATLAYTMVSGQICTAGSRIFVHERIFDEVSEKLVALANMQQVGDPLDPGTAMGPLISKAQLDRVSQYVALGQEEGARLLAGGARVGSKGYFHRPTLFAGTRRDMRIVREEIFGPVAVLIPFTDEEDAVLEGNNTEYGLGAAVWTNDISRAHRVARRLQAGTVWVNTYAEGDPTMPFGGYKQSGLGRENGEEAVHAYTQTKSVFVRL